MHQFFLDIVKHDNLISSCNTEITDLPEPYRGSGTIKAILLGADPTNKGTRKSPGLIRLKNVFGLRSDSDDFFSPQRINLRAISLTEDNLFIQNVCRNYFTKETSRNSVWKAVAQIWLPFLKEELDSFSKEIPVLVTAEIIMKVLTENVPAADVYNLKAKPPFYSKKLERNLYPLYRHPTYLLRSGNWDGYKNYLTNIFK